MTGHTGFKGSWLCSWLLELGAELTGISNEIPTEPSMFKALGLEKHMSCHFIDVRNKEAVTKVFAETQPDFVFHLAAQAIVSKSYSDPTDTISTNVLGTAHILEALRLLQKRCIGIIITSDKCYENVEWPWGYRENDTIGGKDIYSGSKGAAEVIFHAFHCSFFNKTEHPIKVASARAGNVIGGGDWAQDRIVADAMRAWSRSSQVVIRSPEATRPWQHVLEPVGGYLTLGQVLSEKPELSGESFNFGPPSDQTYTVKQLLEELSLQWGFKDPQESYRITDRIPFHEAGLLKLNCDKVKLSLKWTPTLEYCDTIRLVSDWYVGFYQNQLNMLDKTQEQIAFYTGKARERGHIWAQT